MVPNFLNLVALRCLTLATRMTLVVVAAISLGLAQTGRHPAYTFTTLLKSGFRPIVGDIKWMPDGKLLVLTMVMDGHNHVSGPSNLLLLDGVLAGTANDVSSKTFASGFYTPQGLEVVDGQVYVLDNKEGVIKLTDADKDGVAEARAVIWSEGIKNADRKWSGGLAFKDGFFYVPIGTRIISGRSDPVQGKWNGTVAKISLDGRTADVYAGGLRNANGISWGPGGEMLISDNQGDWTPVSRLNEVRQGEFYGHKFTAFDTKTMTPPILWLPHSEVANSPSNIIFLKQGPYKGQALIGEVTNKKILRANLEKVNGRLQGCVFPFASNMPAGVQRLLLAPDNSGSILLAGVGGDGGWTFTEPWYDLERLTPTQVIPFEMLAVRSKDATTLEVEFTKPIAAADAVPARFQVSQWWYEPTSAYGGAKKDTRTLSVGTVTPSADGLKVNLTVTGLQTNHVVQIKLVNMKSKDGETPYGVDGYYTLNAFGPGQEPSVQVKSALPLARSLPWDIRNLGRDARVRPPWVGAFTLRVLLPDGRVLGTYAATNGAEGWECRLPLSAFESGRLLFLEANGAEGHALTKWISP